MLRLIRHWLMRAAYRAAHGVRVAYWRLCKPTIHGCAIVARNDAGELLLVRPSYGGLHWQFPGGGMGPNEDPLEAARREFGEETGLSLREARSLGPRRRTLHGATNVVHVVVGLAEGAPRGDNCEIVQAGWFARKELPEKRAKTVAAYIEIARL